MKTIFNYWNYLRKRSWSQNYDAVNWMDLTFIIDIFLDRKRAIHFLDGYRNWKSQSLTQQETEERK